VSRSIDQSIYAHHLDTRLEGWHVGVPIYIRISYIYIYVHYIGLGIYLDIYLDRSINQFTCIASMQDWEGGMYESTSSSPERDIYLSLALYMCMHVDIEIDT